MKEKGNQHRGVYCVLSSALSIFTNIVTLLSNPRSTVVHECPWGMDSRTSLRYQSQQMLKSLKKNVTTFAYKLHTSSSVP